jgi:hypothetical protein
MRDVFMLELPQTLRNEPGKGWAIGDDAAQPNGTGRTMVLRRGVFQCLGQRRRTVLAVQRFKNAHARAGIGLDFG